MDQRPFSAFPLTIERQGGEHLDDQVIHVKETLDYVEGVPPRCHAPSGDCVRGQEGCLPTPTQLHQIDRLRGPRLPDIGRRCN